MASKIQGIMQAAWAIARGAAARFGGRPQQYIREALRMAWQAARRPVNLSVEEALEIIRGLAGVTSASFWGKGGRARIYAGRPLTQTTRATYTGECLGSPS